MDADDVRMARLAVQRLAGPKAPDAAAAVRESLCVQAQDTPLYLDSIALRSGGTAADVRAALAEGAILRTHVLRPTWHVLASDDLRWVQALTGPRVLSSLAGRRRQLGLDDRTVERAVEVMADALRGHRHLVRRTLGEELVRTGVLQPGPMFGSQVGHLMLAAELRGVVCSGVAREGGTGEQTYALVEERVAPARERSRDEALTELVGRFFASHGPVTWKDLQRWTRLTLTDIRTAVAELGDAVARADVDGIELWYGVQAMDERGPGSSGWAQARREAAGVFLPSIFDEAVLTHSALKFPRLDGHAQGDDPYPFNETGGGLVLAGLRDAGFWKRSHTKRGFALRVHLAPGLPGALVAEVQRAASGLVARNCPAGVPGSVSVSQ